MKVGAAHTVITVVDSASLDLFTARIPEAHAILLMNRDALRLAPVFAVVDKVLTQTDTRLEIGHTAFIDYIQEVAE